MGSGEENKTCDVSKVMLLRDHAKIGDPNPKEMGRKSSSDGLIGKHGRAARGRAASAVAHLAVEPRHASSRGTFYR